jgi:capsular polysaccharide biosynthesis protein
MCITFFFYQVTLSGDILHLLRDNFGHSVYENLINSALPLQCIVPTKLITTQTMDLGYLFNILARRKWLIFTVMLLAAAATFVLIGRKPERYKASVIVSTGIVNYKGINSDDSDAFVQQYQVENAFSNLIEFAKARPTLKLLTLEMLRHDLVSKKDAAFRQPNTELVKISPEELTALTNELTKINLDSLNDPMQSTQHCRSSAVAKPT